MATVLAFARPEETSSFDALYHAHVGRVYALCLRLTGNETAARELTQDTFVRAWEALSEFRGESSVSTWLHRIAVNAMLNDERTAKRRRARVALADDSPDDALAAQRGATQARDVGTRIDLERAISRLAPGLRRAFVLHDVEGYSHEEVARMTGLAAGTLRAQLHRARQILIEALRA